MNLSRRFTGILSSSSTNKWLFRSLSSFRSSPYPSATTKQKNAKTPSSELSDAKRIPLKEPVAWPKPSEIPWQAKVANAVHLIGSIGIPVQLEASPDGKYWGVSVLVQEKTPNFPQFWIPIIFEGDLAQSAACHLKENDLVYVSGQLCGDPPPFSIEHGQTNVQVMVQGISFVQKGHPEKKIHTPYKEIINGSADTTKVMESVESNWRDLIDNSQNWRDHRSDKTNGLVSPKFPDFKHKDTGCGLWLTDAPKWVSSTIGRLKFEVNTPSLKQKKNAHKEESWKDLIENPNKWWDNRLKKLNPKAPDFTNKDTREALWLNSSPAWVLPKLPPLKSKREVAVNKRDTLLS